MWPMPTVQPLHMYKDTQVEMQDIQRIVSGVEPSALLQKEVLSLSEEERKIFAKRRQASVMK